MGNANMRRRSIVLIALLVTSSAIGVRVQQPSPERQEKPENFSPLGFDDLRAYEQAFPGLPGSVEVARASAARYWVFRGVAYRGTQPGGAAWASLGPSSTTAGGASGSGNFSGRVAALAISPSCTVNGPCRLWVGTAGGGVWRSDDAMHPEDAGWRWIGAGLGTNSIGSLTVDPNDESGNTIYVGTGETNSPQNSAAGTGLYRSTDGGDRWARVSTNIVDTTVSPSAIDFTSTRGIASVAIEPGNPQVMYVATTTAMLGMTAVRGGQSQVTGYPQPRVGLYKTENGGSTWSLVWVPPLAPAIPPNPNRTAGQGDTMIGVRWVKLDPRNPRTVYATAWNNAIHRSAPQLENGDAAFKPVFAIVGRGGFQDLAMFDLTEHRGHTRIYVYNGTASTDTQWLYRLDNADVAASTLASGSGASVVNTDAWVPLTSNEDADVPSNSRAICGSQCFYDLVVAVPPGRPDTVLLGGVQNNFGEGTIRSVDAGERFHAFSSDAQPAQNRSHVDVRAIVFHPRNPDIAFVGSDGGVVRNDGTFSNVSTRCTAQRASSPCRVLLSAVPTRLYFLNRGLQTLQFYNVSVDPRAPLQRLLGGLQDNGTVWQDGTGDPGVWKSVFPFGDGTSASGFHPSRAGVLFASFQSNRYFVNFGNGDLSRWVRTDDPIRAANERATITSSTGRQFLSYDEVNPDTQFTGFQHIWRTKNNGGPQAFLEAGCRFPGNGAASPTPCGDWIPLGVAYPFAFGSTPESASRRPGDLTSDAYGSDRAGGVIVAAERSPLDAGTLWAATSAGRLFVSKNADAGGPDVTFARVDTPVIPNRFVTRIVPDRADPNAAFVAYSGFNALTPASPGHLFRVVFTPSSRIAAFTLLDRDLGDLPINTLAVDDARGDLYAATDFGVLVLRRGSTAWELAGIGFPEAVVVDLDFVPSQRVLVAATHGLGIFYLRLDP